MVIIITIVVAGHLGLFVLLERVLPLVFLMVQPMDLPAPSWLLYWREKWRVVNRYLGPAFLCFKTSFLMWCIAHPFLYGYITL